MTDWKILEKIAEGTFGTLYKVQSSKSEEFCALKIFHSKFQNEEDRKRFFKSFQNASKISHPNCVKIIDWYERDLQFGIVMEFVEGKPISALKRKADDSSVYSIGRIIQAMIQVCNGLSALHSQKIIHRDLKPENILIDEKLNVKITDFDFLKNIDATNLTTQGTFIGTVKYSSPEQCEINSKLDQRSDLYSLGVIFYELLTGQVPFDGKNFAEIGIAHLKKELPKIEELFPQIPKNIAKIISKLLEKSTKNRFQTVEDVILDLKEFLEKNKIELHSSQVQTLFPSEFLGRTKEIGKLKNAIIGDYSTKLILISGELGIGKTRFWNEFKKQNSNSSTYFETDCRKENIVYGALQDIILQAINSIKNLNNPQKTAVVGDFGWDLVNIAVQVAQMPFMQNLKKVPEVSGKEGELRLFQTVKATLNNIAEKLNSQVLLYFDNLQWIDEVSLRFLDYFVRKSDGNQIKIIGAFRSGISEKSHFLNFYREFRNDKLVTEISLNALSEKNTEKIIASLLKTKGLKEVGFKSKHFKQTIGNPLFIREFVHTLLDKNQLKRENGNWTLNFDETNEALTSESLFTLISNRLQKLDNEVLEVLKFCAIFGEEFDLDSLAKMMEFEVEKLKSICEFVKNFGVLEKRQNSKKYRFVHDVIIETLLGNLSEEQKRKINFRIGLFLESSQEPNEILIERLAKHFFEAKQQEKGFDYNVKAGEISKKKYAYNKALEYFENAIQLISADKNVEDLLTIGHKKSGLLFEKGDFKEAIKFAKKMITFSSEVGSEIYRARFYNVLGNSLVRLGSIKESIKFLEIALEIYSKAKDELRIAIVTGNIGVAYQKIGNFQKAVECYTQEIAFYERDKNDQQMQKQILKPLINMTTIYTSQSDFDLALKYINQHIKIAKNLNEEIEAALANDCIGNIYLYKSNYTEAEKYYQKAYKFYEQNGLYYKIALTSNNLGLLYFYTGNYEKAMFYFNKKLTTSKEIGDKSGTALAIGNMGLIYEEKGDFTKALECYKEFYQVSKKFSYQMQMKFALGNIGGIYLLQKKYQKALKFTEKSLRLAEELTKNFHSNTILTKAKIYFEIQNYEEAKKLCYFASEKAKKINNSEVNLESKLLTAKIEFLELPNNSRNSKEEIIKSLIKLISTTKNDELLANLNFEIGQMFRGLNEKKTSLKYFEESQKVFKKLVTKTPKYLFKEKLKEIEKNIKEMSKKDNNKLLHLIFRFLNPETAFSELLNYLVEQCEADSCQIIFRDEISGSFEVKAISQNLKKDDISFSRGIIEKCIKNEQSLRIENAVVEEEFQTNQSVIGKPFLSIISFPLISTKESISGAIYLSRETLKIGAFDENDVEEVRKISELLIPLLIRQENDSQAKISSEIQELGIFVGKSPQMKRVYEEIEEAANVNFTVYIQGETGTGKELVAEALHKLSQRKNEPFIAINCSTIPKELAESELFGHEKGAFSGALSTRKGKFEIAKNGTLFLDEIAELPLETQAKLLRVIQKKEIWRVGGESEIKISARIVVATHKDLKKEVANGDFREDLFHRLDVLKIVVPPLRERKSDILPLSFHFLEKFCEETGKEISGFSGTAVLGMENYDWSGNVRELENTIAKAVVKHKKGELLFVENIFDKEVLKNVAKQIPSIKNDNSEVQSLYERMVNLKESFWNVISEPYLDRELNRSQVKAVLELGMQEVKGSLKNLSILFQIPDTRQDYMRFMNFLRRNKLK